MLTTSFGRPQLNFRGPDDDGLALVEDPADTRARGTGDIAHDKAIRGFHSASLRLRDAGATAELLGFMGYQPAENDGAVTQLIRPDGNGADFIDLETLPGAPVCRGSAPVGASHRLCRREPGHPARGAQGADGYRLPADARHRPRLFLLGLFPYAGRRPVREIATSRPGFDRDEDFPDLGEALKLPRQHEHLRAALEQHLQSWSEAMDSYSFRRSRVAYRAPLLILLHGDRWQRHDPARSRSRPDAGRASDRTTRRDVSGNGALRFFRRTGEGRLTTWPTSPGNHQARRFHRRNGHVSARRPSPWAYSNGANILASVLFATPALVDRAVLMHPIRSRRRRNQLAVGRC